MTDANILFYGGIFLIVCLAIIFKPEKRGEPSRLSMKRRRQDPSNAKQIGGARWVQAENVDTLDADDLEDAAWVNPTITYKGKVLDAYSVLGLVPGASLEQIKSHAAEKIRLASSEQEKQKILQALKAIEKSAFKN